MRCAQGGEPFFVCFSEHNGSPFVFLSCRSRNLQKIFINYPSPSTAPPQSAPAPTGQVRPTEIVVCQATDGNVSAMRTQVPLDYYVETGGSNCPSSGVTSIVSETMLVKISHQLCGGKEGQMHTTNSTGVTNYDPINGTTSTSNTSGTNGGRRLAPNVASCVISVTTGPAATDAGSCTSLSNASTCCHDYTDSLYVLHLNNCSAEEVSAASQSYVSNQLGSSDFLSQVNNQSMATNGVSVTKLGPYSPPASSSGMGMTAAASMQTTTAQSTTGLTAAGAAMIALAALAAVVLGGTLLAWRRYIKRRNQRLEDDLKSCHTDWSHASMERNWLEPNFRDLALKHSKLDVHKCKSALCHVCRPTLGVVHMLPVDRGTSPLAPPVRAPLGDTSSSSGSDDSQHGVMDAPATPTSPSRGRTATRGLGGETNQLRSVSPLTEAETFHNEPPLSELEDVALHLDRVPPSDHLPNEDEYTYVRATRYKRATRDDDSVAPSVVL